MFIRPTTTQAFFRQVANNTSCAVGKVVVRGGDSRRAILLSSSTSSTTRRGFADVAVAGTASSHWENFTMAPPDPIIGLTEVCYYVIYLYFYYLFDLCIVSKSNSYFIVTHSQAYLKDDFPNKVNVGVGAYRDDNGKPFVLPVVRDAEKEINLENVDHEYSGIVSFVGKHTSLICVLAASPLISHLVDTFSTTTTTITTPNNRRDVQAL